MNSKLFFTFLFALLIALGGGYWAITQGLIPGLMSTNGSASGSAPMAAAAAEKPLFYRNPMNPAITSPVPAQDNMGMDYIPVFAEKKMPKAKQQPLFYRSAMNPNITSPVPAKDEMGMDYIPVFPDVDAASDAPTGTVSVDPVTVQNMGVRTATAELQSLSRQVRAVGRVAFNEEKITRIHPKTEGWVEKLFIDKTGQQVSKNSILLSVYSPQLVSSQQEYLLALNNLQTLSTSPFADIRNGAQQMVETSRERLEFLDVPEHQIHELESSGTTKKSLHIHSPFRGIVINIGAREGQYVTPATELFMLADLSTVWVYADIYEYELPWIKTGDTVEMQLAGIPGRTFVGRLAYVYPYAEAKTRTVQVRLEFDNSDLMLKPDMYAEVTIQAQRQEQAVTIPAEAVVRSGERNQVFVVREAGKFEPREVKLGLTDQGRVQILEGVKAGETVVTSSQFLIDSESKLREATAKMLEAINSGSKEKTAPEMDMSASMHEGMSAEKMAEHDMQAGDMPQHDMSKHDMQVDEMQKHNMESEMKSSPEAGHRHD